ncbi:hypothetical protein ACFL20_09030 [Spirochaetota bacterium]
MKKILVLIILALLFGCQPKKNIEFCEGVTVKGVGVECGIKFGTGDLTVLIKSNDPFDTNRIFIELYEDFKGKMAKLETINVEVKPDQSRVSSTLSMYRHGKYIVKAIRGKEVIAQGEIEIVDY